MISKDDIKIIKGGVLLAIKEQKFTDAIEASNKVLPILKEHIKYFQNYRPELKDLSNEDINDILDDIVRDIEDYELDECDCIAEEKALNDDWLEKQDIQFSYTERYLKYLDKKGWENIEVLRNNSFKILQMLGDPNVDRISHRKGLMIGDVQSGKTASYTTILNRAVDVGYDVILVLTGTTENLRVQTQKRIETDLIGTTSEEDVADKVVGVGKITPLNKVLRATSVTHDYSKKIAATQAVPIVKGETLLFVSKKNVTTLKCIKNALNSSNANNKVNDIINGSILILDDESDNASVDTNKPENNPTAINRSIRDILNLFARTGYLAVTATPFANIFIDDSCREGEYSRDLFPSDFICLLDRPAKYLGANKLFGDVAISGVPRWTKKGNTYSELCIVEISEKENMPYAYKHKNEIRVEGSEFENLPVPMKKAIRYFILVQKLMDYSILLNDEPHRTMMINVSRFVDVQDDLYEVIKTWLRERLKPQVKKYGYMPQEASNLYTGEYYRLKQVWDEENLEAISGKDWNSFSRDLTDSIDRLRVAIENNKHSKKEKLGLNYSDYPKGDRVIVVGGQCLSRGLTLEGLVVSYFFRNSAMYDTLLQMGRWFGYRNAYIQYFKIWISVQSNSWYSLIADATEDLRSQIREMNERNMTPSQFGLAVKYHPATGLIVTARNKMRGVKVYERKVPIDIGGHLIESARLSPDPKINECNSILINDFLSNMTGEYTRGVGGFYWSGIDRCVIAKLVKNFQSAKLSLGFMVEELASYIEKNSTEKWSVGIAQYMNTDELPLENFPELKRVRRPYNIEDDGTSKVMKIYGHHVKIGSGTVTKLGLTKEDIKKIQASIRKGEDKDNDSLYLRNRAGTKRESILILYPLDLMEDNIKGKKYYEEPVTRYNHGEVVWGIGLGFACDKPAEDDASCFSYVLNPVAVNLAWELEDDGGENDE